MEKKNHINFPLLRIKKKKRGNETSKDPDWENCRDYYSDGNVIQLPIIKETIILQYFNGFLCV